MSESCIYCQVNTVGHHESKCPILEIHPELSRDVEYKEQVKGILNEFAQSLDKITKKYEPKWFKASSPLPDGDYGWRWDKEDAPIIVKYKAGQLFVNSSLIFITAFLKQYYRGEFCLIVWPD